MTPYKKFLELDPCLKKVLNTNFFVQPWSASFPQAHGWNSKFSYKHFVGLPLDLKKVWHNSTPPKPREEKDLAETGFFRARAQNTCPKPTCEELSWIWKFHANPLKGTKVTALCRGTHGCMDGRTLILSDPLTLGGIFLHRGVKELEPLQLLCHLHYKWMTHRLNKFEKPDLTSPSIRSGHPLHKGVWPPNPHTLWWAAHLIAPVVAYLNRIK